jgi:hypothetical protein
LRIDTRTRLSLLSRVRCVFRDSSELEHCMMNWTTKFRIPRELDYDPFETVFATNLGTAPSEGLSIGS